MRIAIVGNSGSGKSTAARELAAGVLPVLDLDTVAWEPGRAAVPRPFAAAAADVAAFCTKTPGWIVEGCYAGLVGEALKSGPLLVFLDPGVEACVANCLARPFEPHKYRSKVEQDERLGFLIGWVRDYYVRDGELSHAGHRALFDGYGGPKRRLGALPARGAVRAALAAAADPGGRPGHGCGG